MDYVSYTTEATKIYDDYGIHSKTSIVFTFQNV